MNKEQIDVIRCAYLDLLGVREAFDIGDPFAIDTKAVRITLGEMEQTFGEELSDLMENEDG